MCMFYLILFYEYLYCISNVGNIFLQVVSDFLSLLLQLLTALNPTVNCDGDMAVAVRVATFLDLCKSYNVEIGYIGQLSLPKLKKCGVQRRTQFFNKLPNFKYINRKKPPLGSGAQNYLFYS